MLRTTFGFATIGFGTSFCGAALVLLVLLVQGIPAEVGDNRWILLVCAGGYVLLSFAVGTVWAGFLQRRTVLWFVAGRRPGPHEAARALRVPVDLAVVSGTLWAGGAVTLGVLTTVLGSWLDAVGVVLAIVLGGLATVGMTYLAAERTARPVMSLALPVALPRDRHDGHLPATVLRRLVVTWSLAGGVPLFGVLFVVLPPDIGTDEPRLTLISLAAIGLVVGALGTGLLARAVAAPLHRLRLALDDIARGRRDIAIGIDDASEIGMLQASVNDLATGLAERERLRDLFGRHVGDDVVRHVLEHGISLSGDVREVTALFVDVVDSTALAAHTPPEEVVRRLNALFTDVVEAVDAHGGLVNKFQGDAALCVFGAPARHADAAGAALCAARTIRDAVAARGELDLGIGVATGQVFAGQLGAFSRLEYTVIGDAVNEAARLTEHAKQVPGRVLASQVTVEAAAPAERAHWDHH
ncbi:adenylate/guanylate cyclase domain-containing protein, partial [Saccharomonospora saliphila]|uniref:adenylate/guanylate cyclase domain-containing protein n=1 Tax=Saccharomonospora saliphila TaxID=369829 RepID=UPI0006626693